MKRLAMSSLGAALLGAALLWASTGFSGAAAQSAAAHSAASSSPLDTIPPKLPFNVPYGPPITLQRAQALLQAAIAEAVRRGWPLNVAVVDSGGNLVAFARMDGAMLASIKIAEHKARVAVTYRRPTRAFEDAIQKQNSVYVMTLDDIIASRGGIPLIEDGKLIGAIGCSGGAGSQDEAVCTAAAATINR